MALRTYRSIKGLMVWTSGETAAHIIDNPVIGDEGAIYFLIVHVRQVSPEVDVRFADPKVIAPKGGDWHSITEQDHAFAYWPIIRQVAGELACHGCAISGLNIESHNRIGTLPRNGGAVDAVACNQIPAGASIVHGDRNVIVNSRDRVEAVKEGGSGHAIWILNSGGHHNRLTGGRERGCVRNFINGGPRIGYGPAVSCARSSEGFRHWHGARCFHPVAVYACNRFSPALEPARLKPDGVCLASISGTGAQACLHVIASGPELAAGADVQGVAGTAKPGTDLQARSIMITQWNPPVQICIEGRVRNDIHAGCRNKFDVIDQAFAAIEQSDLQP